VSDKTEEPTPRRLQKAFDDGNLPISATLTATAAFLAASAALPAAGRALAAWVIAALRSPQPDPATASRDAILAVLSLSIPPLLAAALLAIVVGAAQARGFLSPQKALPDLGRLSPLRGLGSLADPQRLISLGRALLTFAAFALLARLRLRDAWPELLAASGSPAKAAEAVAEASRLLLRDAGLVLLASSLVDLGLVLRSWRAKLRMSHQEIKQESKESEGDPQLKAARERAHHELLSQASIGAVKDATVLVVNPTHLATALRYLDEEDTAPRVLASGEGLVARQMMDAARAYNVPIVRDVPLARALREIETGEEIPEALYEAVAEVLRSLGDAPEGE
jgi:flagellar biosynthesis protein FlhB